MYNPIQLPIILTNRYQTFFEYTLKSITELNGFAINTFESISKPTAPKEFDNSFDEEYFFSLSYEEAKSSMIHYMIDLVNGHTPNEYTRLFDELIYHPPILTQALYDYVHLSPRQSRRVFAKNYGHTPKQILTILRFQRTLQLLIQEEHTKTILDQINYYDQAHFIKEFKRKFGITPRELIKEYIA